MRCISGKIGRKATLLFTGDEMKKEKHFIANGYGVRGHKVLLGFHKKQNKWLPLGGHIKKEETPDAALRREFMEESGLEIEFFTPKDYESRRIKHLSPPQKMNLVSAGNRHPLHINLIYFCRIKKGNAKISKREHRELQWFSKGDLKKVSLDPDVRLYAKQAIDFARGKRK